MHTSKDIQANEADFLGVDCFFKFFARVHPEQRVPGLQANVCLSDMCNCEFFAGFLDSSTRVARVPEGSGVPLVRLTILRGGGRVHN